ncbi:hypothetical protein AAMO2058_000321900 [Amorphochlora amoebiformis]
METLIRRGLGWRRQCMLLWAALGVVVLICAVGLAHMDRYEIPNLRMDVTSSASASGHKVRRWHRVESKQVDQAALATVIGVGVHVVGRKIAAAINNRTAITDEKLKALYKRCLEEQKLLREQFQKELAAKDKSMQNLKIAASEKIGEVKAEAESRIRDLSGKTYSTLKDSEALTKKIGGLEYELGKAKAVILKEKELKVELETQLDTLKTQTKAAKTNLSEMHNLENELTTSRKQTEQLTSELSIFRKQANDLQEELDKAKRKLKASSGPARLDGDDKKGDKSSKWAKLPWKDIAVTTSILGGGAAIGLGIGANTLKGRLREEGTPEANANSPAMPPIPPVPIFAYDTPFGSHERVVEVEPCPCLDDPEKFDWKWWLIIVMALFIFFEMLINHLIPFIQKKYAMWSEIQEQHLGAVREDVRMMEVQIREHEYEEQELEVKAKVLDYLRQVDQALQDAQVTLAAHHPDMPEEGPVEVSPEDVKEVKELHALVEDCLEESLVPPEEDTQGAKAAGDSKIPVLDTNKKKIYAYKFVKALTLKKYNSVEGEEVRMSMTKQLKDEDHLLDKNTQVEWEGNEFDEKEFIRTHLQHVEVKNSPGKSESSPVVPGAESKRVKDIVGGFERETQVRSASQVTKPYIRSKT